MVADAATADPLRQSVEATLRRLVDDLAALPCQAVKTARARLAEPIAVVTSIIGLATSGFIGAPATKGATATERRSPSAPPPAPTRRADRPAAVDGDRPDAAELPIDDYESLAASQVVARLERLTPAELERIEAFEAAHRGRRTVLGKIEQLSGRQ